MEELALGLPRLDKLRLMESLWENLSREPDGIESPGWHKRALEETEGRLARGEEEIMGWEDAKRRLSEDR